jgi:hypothetical protein
LHRHYLRNRQIAFIFLEYKEAAENTATPWFFYVMRVPACASAQSLHRAKHAGFSAHGSSAHPAPATGANI